METAPTQSPPITVDLHIDVPWLMTKRGYCDLLENQPARDVDIHRMKQGGLHSAFFALYLSDQYQDTLKDPQLIKSFLNQQIDYILLQKGYSCPSSVKSVPLFAEDNKIPIFFGIEGGRLLAYNKDWLSDFWQRYGMKYLTAVHNRTSECVDSATDYSQHHGITKTGKDFLTAVAQLGVLLDVSHASDNACEAMLDLSPHPVVATHSGCRKLVNHPRNLSPQLIKKIAATGGLIGIPFVHKFIGDRPSCVIDHVEEVIQLVGPKHVSVGSDLDGAKLIPGIKDVSSWSSVVIDGLANRGYSQEVINMVAGGNALRVFGEAEKV